MNRRWRWAVPVVIVVALAAAGATWQRSGPDGINADAWGLLRGAGHADRFGDYDSSLADIAPGQGFETPDGRFVHPADVIVRGRVVDVRPARAFFDFSPGRDGATDQEIPYEAAPDEFATKVVRLIVSVDEVIAGSLPEGVEDRVGVEVIQPIDVTIEDLREAFTAEGGGVYFLRDYRALWESAAAGRPIVVPTPPGVYRIFGDTLLFVDDGVGGIDTPYLDEWEAEALLGPARTFEELLTLVRQFS